MWRYYKYLKIEIFKKKNESAMNHFLIHNTRLNICSRMIFSRGQQHSLQHRAPAPGGMTCRSGSIWNVKPRVQLWIPCSNTLPEIPYTLCGLCHTHRLHQWTFIHCLPLLFNLVKATAAYVMRNVSQITLQLYTSAFHTLHVLPFNVSFVLSVASVVSFWITWDEKCDC